MTCQLSSNLSAGTVSKSFEQMALNMLISGALSPRNTYQTDFLPNAGNAGFLATYADQVATASPTAQATNYGMNEYGSHDQSSNNNNLSSLPSSLTDDRRLHPPSLMSPTASLIVDSPLAPIRQRRTSSVDYSGPGVSSGRGVLALNRTATCFSLPSHRTLGSAYSSSYYPQSTNSLISSASSYPYYSGSMDSDIPYISDMYDAARPNPPRPTGMIHSQILNHQTSQAAMTRQFNSRPRSNTTKKHKCKVCNKRFTRPSSLQTHIYSHTGEKPFACEVEGCGRQFSVVSNLRRHGRVHR